MTVVAAPLGKGTMVRVLLARIEHSAGDAVLRHTVAPQIAEMRRKRSTSRPMPDDPHLDGDLTGAIAKEPNRRQACRAAAAERATTT